MRMQGYCDVYKWTILKRTSPEVKCLHLTSSRHEMCTLSVSNVLYHKFSHGAAFYTLNGKNINIMLEFLFASPDQYLFDMGSTLKEKICSSQSKFFPIRVNHCFLQAYSFILLHFLSGILQWLIYYTLDFKYQLPPPLLQNAVP